VLPKTNKQTFYKTSTNGKKNTTLLHQTPGRDKQKEKKLQYCAELTGTVVGERRALEEQQRKKKKKKKKK
jgi:uncharacterized membrane protein